MKTKIMVLAGMIVGCLMMPGLAAAQRVDVVYISQNSQDPGPQDNSGFAWTVIYDDAKPTSRNPSKFSATFQPGNKTYENIDPSENSNDISTYCRLACLKNPSRDGFFDISKTCNRGWKKVN